MGTPISQLSSMTSASTADLAVLVDVSDPTMAASGTDKKITVGALTASILPVPVFADVTALRVLNTTYQAPSSAYLIVQISLTLTT